MPENNEGRGYDEGKPSEVAKSGETFGWLSETLESLRQTVGRRIGNPVISSFLLSWSVINYRIWLTVFGDMTSNDKIEAINSFVVQAGWVTLLWVPLIFAIVIPFVEVIATGFAKLLDNWRKGLLLVIDELQPVSSEEKQRFFKDIRESAKLKHAELDRLIASHNLAAQGLTKFTDGLITRLHEVSAVLMAERNHYGTSGRAEMEPSFTASNWRSSGISWPVLNKVCGGLGEAVARFLITAHSTGTSTFFNDSFGESLKLEGAQLNQLLNYLLGSGLIEESYVDGDRVIRINQEGPSYRQVMYQLAEREVERNPHQRNVWEKILANDPNQLVI